MTTARASEGGMNMPINTVISTKRGDVPGLILAVKDFGARRGIEALVKYQAVGGTEETVWLPTWILSPTLNWTALAKGSTNLQQARAT